MKNIYIIELLCNDTDNVVYNDTYINCYSTFNKAKEILDKLIQEEYCGLKEESKYVYIIDYNDDKQYQRELWLETMDYEYMLTRYTIK